jgi:5'-nucleotidase
VTEELPSLVSPAGIVDLDVLPVVETVNAYADQLSDGDEANDEADVVVLLVHEDAQGAIEDSEFSWRISRRRGDAGYAAHSRS